MGEKRCKNQRITKQENNFQIKFRKYKASENAIKNLRYELQKMADEAVTMKHRVAELEETRLKIPWKK